MNTARFASSTMATNVMLHSLVLGSFIAFSPSADADRLEISGIVGGEKVAVMIDGRRASGVGGCVNDVVFRTTGSVELPNANLLAPAGCRSEIAVFSSRNAMFLAKLDSLTNNADDLIKVKLKPIIRAPVHVWVADSTAQDTAKEHMARANVLYRINKVGVRFVPVFHNISADANAVALVRGGIEIVNAGNGIDYACKDLLSIQQSTSYVEKTLNIYYVALNIGGRNCAIKATPTSCTDFTDTTEGDGNITYIGRAADRSTLAHEIGHAFGLRPGPCGGHPTVEDDGITSRNIMAGDGDGDSNRFTLGQVLRMNTHTDQWGGTMLIKNGLRPGPGRACPPRKKTGACPALRKDWQRP